MPAVLKYIGNKMFAMLSLVGTALYLMTMDRSASWWDCGEFISTSYLLQVGHPPGAPMYTLLAHLFTLLSFGNPMLVAPMSNALSAVAGGLTVGLLYLTIMELGCRHKLGAVVGALCYLLCDTAWFSATESEVYALAMLCCSAQVWLTLRWRNHGNARRLLLVALLTGLGVCIHFMTLLVTPALLLLFVQGAGGKRKYRLLPAMALFFLLGLTPYATIPIRAAAGTPINEMGSSFGSYIKRDQYAKAPLYPRMWRQRDSKHWAQWTTSGNTLLSNTIYFVTYQAGYMYGRYLMYNFAGRQNAKHRMVVLFVLPALLGCYGLYRHHRQRRNWWVIMLLFLMGGIVLNIYLNHPCYEPRERDYVYVLSFYAFAAWVGIGAAELQPWLSQHKKWLPYLLLLSPLTMAIGNYSDHDRHRLHSVHDLSMAHLQSCDSGAVLITLGDNDTFPLWYLQQVERQRTDITIYNIGLTGYSRTMRIIAENIGKRPVYVSQYFYDRYSTLFEGHLRCEGLCWRIVQQTGDVADTEPLRRHVADSVQWHITNTEYTDRVARGMLRAWQNNISTAGL